MGQGRAEDRRSEDRGLRSEIGMTEAEMKDRFKVHGTKCTGKRGGPQFLWQLSAICHGFGLEMTSKKSRGEQILTP
jgi:hypothetical protein